MIGGFYSFMPNTIKIRELIEKMTLAGHQHETDPLVRKQF